MIHRLSRSVDRFLRGFLVIWMTLMVTSVSAQFILRYVFDTAYYFLEEIALFSMVYVTFLGAAVVFKSNSHIRIGIVRKVVPAALLRFLDVIAALGTGGFLLLAIIKGGELALQVMGQKSLAMHIPMSAIYASIPLSALAMFIHAASLLAGGRSLGNDDADSNGG